MSSSSQALDSGMEGGCIGECRSNALCSFHARGRSVMIHFHDDLKAWGAIGADEGARDLAEQLC